MDVTFSKHTHNTWKDSLLQLGSVLGVLGLWQPSVWKYDFFVTAKPYYA